MLHSIKDTAEILSVSRAHLYRMIDQGVIRVTRLGRRSLISDAELERLVEDHTEGAA